MRYRDEARGRAVLDVLGHHRAQLEAAAAIPDVERRTKREATLEATKRRDLAAVYRRLPNQSFRSWAIAHRTEIERGAFQLERQVERAQKNHDQQRQYEARRAREQEPEREAQRDVSREQQKKNRGRSR
jgi:hypothetical protein